MSMVVMSTQVVGGSGDGRVEVVVIVAGVASTMQVVGLSLLMAVLRWWW